MELKIMSCWRARKFEPCKPTAAMRIYSGEARENCHYGELINSGLYVRTFYYEFDDIHGMSGDEMDRASSSDDIMLEDVIPMSRKTAEQIVRDFVSVRDRVDCLMIHCKMGEGRSAAVGMGLNEVFDFGESGFVLEKQYPNYNRGVYDLVVEAAKGFELGEGG